MDQSLNIRAEIITFVEENIEINLHVPGFWQWLQKHERQKKKIDSNLEIWGRH